MALLPLRPPMPWVNDTLAHVGMWLKSLATILTVLVLAACSASAPQPRQALMLMSALPLIWGEGDARAILNGPDQRHPLVRELATTHDIVPLDLLSSQTLKAGSIVLLVQPRGLAPQELVDLDAWIRGGGNAIIMADPLLLWPLALPLGDPRRAPSVTLLDPLLTHWGLRLSAPDPEQAGEADIDLEGTRVAGLGVGRWHVERGTCRTEADARLALCSLGKGRALLVADADWLDHEATQTARAALSGLLVRVAAR